MMAELRNIFERNNQGGQVFLIIIPKFIGAKCKVNKKTQTFEITGSESFYLVVMKDVRKTWWTRRRNFWHKFFLCAAR